MFFLESSTAEFDCATGRTALSVQFWLQYISKTQALQYPVRYLPACIPSLGLPWQPILGKDLSMMVSTCNLPERCLRAVEIEQAGYQIRRER